MKFDTEIMCIMRKDIGFFFLKIAASKVHSAGIAGKASVQYFLAVWCIKSDEKLPLMNMKKLNIMTRKC